MVSSQKQVPQRVSGEQAAVGRLFLLDLSDDRIVSLNSDGSDREVIVTECRYPDGIALDVAAGHIYWTNMGVPKLNDGSIERADLDGRNRMTIVPQGGTFTPKQLQLEKKSRKLYWCDREGMRVMRANLDGSHIETIVDTSQGDSRPGPDASRWCVGVAVDVDGGKVYWTQKGPDNAGKGRICRAGIDAPTGQTASNRADIEVLYDGLPEPIDLDLDLNNRVVYWTDRGDPPRGNTVNRAPMDSDAKGRPAPEIVFSHLMEGIGIALDLKRDRMFITDFGGDVLSAKLDGSDPKALLVAQGNLTGIAYYQISGRRVIVSYEKPIRRIAVVGTGVIGASWAAQYLARGLDVVATDPAPNAEVNLRKYVDEAWGQLDEIGLSPGASRDRLSFTTDSTQAFATADFVQENGPERPDFKMKLFAHIDEATPLDSIIASSSSGITPSVIQSACKHPERVIVGHPFNPPHIVPLVEVVGG